MAKKNDTHTFTDVPVSTSSDDWFVYDPKTEKQKGPYTTAQVKAVLSDRSKKFADHLMFWAPSAVDWITLDETRYLLGLPKRTGLTQTSSLLKPIYKNSQAHKRYVEKVEVTFLLEGGRTFMTSTRNVSEGGIAFEPPVPLKFFNSTALVFLYSPMHKQRFSTNVEVIQPEDNTVKRAKFTGLSGKALDILRAWLTDWERKEIERKTTSK